MARFTKMNPTDFKRMTWDAGIILGKFDPETGEFDPSDIRWATTGDNSFSATRELIDLGEPINNCPENTAQLQRARQWAAEATGTAVTVDAEQLRDFLGNADIETISEVLKKIVPRADLSMDDFKDAWFVTNFSDLNGETKGGYCAFHIMNALSSDGFSGTFGKNTNGTFPYTLRAFYDMESMDTVPFEIYIKTGEKEAGGSEPEVAAYENL